MKYNEKTIKLKNGIECTFKSPTKEKAQEMIDYLRITSTETDFLVRYPDEVDFTIEDEEKILGENLESQTDLMINAVVNGEIVGNCGLHIESTIFKVNHRAKIGISIRQEYCGMGLGTALMESIIEIAKNKGYEQLELGVYAENKRAIGLYEKLGFIKYGVLPNSFKFRDGTYHDENLMFLKIK